MKNCPLCNSGLPGVRGMLPIFGGDRRTCGHEFHEQVEASVEDQLLEVIKQYTPNSPDEITPDYTELPSVEAVSKLLELYKVSYEQAKQSLHVARELLTVNENGWWNCKQKLTIAERSIESLQNILKVEESAMTALRADNERWRDLANQKVFGIIKETA